MFIEDLADKVVPLPRGARKAQPKRVVTTKKLPSWHLTGSKTMAYVKEANDRSMKKKEEVEKENKVKKEAVNKFRASEQKANKKRK